MIPGTCVLVVREGPTDRDFSPTVPWLPTRSVVCRQLPGNSGSGLLNLIHPFPAFHHVQMDFELVKNPSDDMVHDVVQVARMVVEGGGRVAG